MGSVGLDTTLAARPRLRLPGVVRSLDHQGLPWPAWLVVDAAGVHVRGLLHSRGHCFRPGCDACWQTPRHGSARLELRGRGGALSFRPRYGARRLTRALERAGFSVELRAAS